MTKQYRYIWRVETNDRRRIGPYRAGIDWYEVMVNYKANKVLDRVNSNRHPTPNSDPRLTKWWNTLLAKERKRYKCGFATLKQFRRWFYVKGARDILAAHNFVLVKYKVPAHNVHFGNYQVVFKNPAQAIEKRPVNYI